LLGAAQSGGGATVAGPLAIFAALVKAIQTAPLVCKSLLEALHPDEKAVLQAGMRVVVEVQAQAQAKQSQVSALAAPTAGPKLASLDFSKYAAN